MKKMYLLFKNNIIIIIIFASLAVSGCIRGYVTDISKFDFKDGDIMLQHMPGRLASVIADVTNSQYSHCGIIVYKKGKPYVLEAIGPVKYTPVKDWINQGFFGRFTQYRVRNVSDNQIKKVINEAEKMLGKPYDIQYELDEKKIYCSELVYKAYLRGAKIQVGIKESLGTLKWQPHKDFIKYITGGEVPLKRELVSPESLTRGSHVVLIYSTFPPKSDEPLYAMSDLEGVWKGDYTIRGGAKVKAAFKLDSSAKFIKGGITLSNGRIIHIESLSITPFTQAREFYAGLIDSRGIKALVHAQIRDHGRRLIGTWRDNAGYSGVFSFEKK